MGAEISTCCSHHQKLRESVMRDREHTHDVILYKDSLDRSSTNKRFDAEVSIEHPFSPKALVDLPQNLEKIRTPGRDGREDREDREDREGREGREGREDREGGDDREDREDRESRFNGGPREKVGGSVKICENQLRKPLKSILKKKSDNFDEITLEKENSFSMIDGFDFKPINYAKSDQQQDSEPSTNGETEFDKESTFDDSGDCVPDEDHKGLIQVPSDGDPRMSKTNTKQNNSMVRSFVSVDSDPEIRKSGSPAESNNNNNRLNFSTNKDIDRTSTRSELTLPIHEVDRQSGVKIPPPSDVLFALSSEQGPMSVSLLA